MPTPDRHRGPFARLGLTGIAFVWGAAEAALFFIVPDVLISFVVLRNLRLGLRLAIWATAGSLLGGAFMYAWGAGDPMRAFEMLNSLPAITHLLIKEVGHGLETHGLAAMLTGPVLGVPYKIYAAQAGALDFSFLSFLLYTLPARLPRFLIVALVVWYLSRRAEPHLSFEARVGVLAAGWIIFYIGYFVLMPG